MAIPSRLQREQAEREPFETVSHPGWGVDIEGVFSAFRRADGGSPRTVFDVIDDRTRVDGKLRGMVNARVAAVTGRLALILPGGQEPEDVRAAEELRASIDQYQIDMHRYLEHAMMAPLKYGYGLSEQTWTWNPDDRRYDVTDLFHVRSRNTRISTSTRPGATGAAPEEILVQVGAHEHEVARQIPNKYIEIRATHEEPPQWAGLGVTSTVISTMKMQAVAGNLTFLDRYGLPFLDVTVDDWASDSDKETARDIIRRFGRDGGIVRPKNAKIVIQIHDAIVNSRNATSDVHVRFWDKCDEENAVLWNGAPYATQSGSEGSSYALAQEQGNVEFRLTLADRQRIERATCAQWFRRWMRFNNMPGATPTLRIFIERIENPQVAVQIATELATIGYKVDPAQLMEMTGMRRDESAGDDTQDEPTDREPVNDV